MAHRHGRAQLATGQALTVALIESTADVLLVTATPPRWAWARC
jgi:hypothetical protein